MPTEMTQFDELTSSVSAEFIYNIRPATVLDFPLIYGLCHLCENPAHAQFPIPKGYLQFFNLTSAIVPIQEGSYSFIHYFILEIGDKLPVGFIANRRSRVENHELVGMLINPFFQSKGIGTQFLRKFVQERYDSGASRVEGIVSKSNTACVKASQQAGGVVIKEIIFSVNNVDSYLFHF